MTKYMETSRRSESYRIPAESEEIKGKEKKEGNVYVTSTGKKCDEVQEKSFVLLVTLNVVLLGTLVSLAVYRLISQHRSLDQTFAEFSVHCDKLKTTGYAGNVTRREEKNVCHVDRDKYISHRIHQILVHEKGSLEEQEERKTLLKILSDHSQDEVKKPFAHVVLTSDILQTKVLIWNITHEASQISPRITYEDIHLHVHQSGFYYVYSHLTFKERKEFGLNRHRVTHSVLKAPLKDPGKTDTILYNSLTACEIKSGKSVETSYLGGTFYLERDTLLSVSTDVHENLDLDPHRSFWGLYFI